MFTEAKKTKETGAAIFDSWLEDLEAIPSSEIIERCKTGQLPEALSKKVIVMGIQIWPEGKESRFKASLTDTLGEVFSKASDVLGIKLLPPAPAKALDIFRAKLQRGDWSKPILNLEEPLWIALGRGFTRHLSIEYKLVVKLNSVWGIAPSQNSTPRELLAAFGMDANEFTLYPVDSPVEFPVDTPLKIERGDAFEVQKDGKYGSGIPAKALVNSGTQTIEDDVQLAKEAGFNIRLLEVGEQKYVEVRGVKIPIPPWKDHEAAILIAVPATYPCGGLDAFYLQLPMGHDSGAIPYQQSVAQINGHQWALISWHYHESRPWNPRQDNLQTHIEHCRGFFLTRGVR